ncbi:MAG: 1-acyl-sn-glycerol-3-phosphate acyltransferase [Gemmatimonadales bacterium]|nr:1-acyl-sn-glycerol-3-phosphate acyltransferase [Gemmatimonadales bacterium]
MRTAIFYVALVLSTIFFGALAATVSLVGGGRAWMDRANRGWARAVLSAAGVRVTVHGLEHLDPSGVQIIAANHQSYFDIWALIAGLPASVRFIAKRELGNIPMLSVGMRSAGHVLIDRDRPRSARKTLREASDRMRAERLTLVLFPEGTRSRDGRLGRFRRGAFALARETRAPLVPAAIDGGRRVYAPGAKRVRPGAITVRLAPAIRLEGAEPADRGTLMRETRAAIEAMLPQGGAGGGASG